MIEKEGKRDGEKIKERERERSSYRGPNIHVSSAMSQVTRITCVRHERHMGCRWGCDRGRLKVEEEEEKLEGGKNIGNQMTWLSDNNRGPDHP